MHRWIKTAASLMALSVSVSAWAQDYSEPAAEQATSTAEVSEIVEVFQSPYQLFLSPGVISFESAGAESESRLLTSVLVSRNFSSLGPARGPIQYGAEFGLAYSHLGAPGSNFFGAGGGTGDGNLFILPLHLWAGYYFENSRVFAGLHTGTDFYLRSNETSIVLGREGTANFFPAFGFRVGWDPARNYAITFQGNWTLAPNEAVFQAMLGAVIPLS